MPPSEQNSKHENPDEDLISIAVALRIEKHIWDWRNNWIFSLSADFIPNFPFPPVVRSGLRILSGALGMFFTKQTTHIIVLCIVGMKLPKSVVKGANPFTDENADVESTRVKI